ncbi:MAG: Gfo/Idh/MocA family protein [Alphaproteobacteria bacterium]
MSKPLRIGILGAARITPSALLGPARKVEGVAVSAIAARDKNKAAAFATKHAIPTVHETYEALLADPQIDAIYNPLPNSHHGLWSIKALEAGKHVLCEKPLAANADEAAQMAEVAKKNGRILAEAFHWRYHPLAGRMKEIMASGRLGKIEHIEAHFCVPLLEPRNIRWRLDLAGGALMDTGCYTINMVRHLAEAEPHVVAAKAWKMREGVDRRVQAAFAFDDGRTGGILCSMAGWPLLRACVQVRGGDGVMTVQNPLAPQLYHSITIEDAHGREKQKVPGDATYTHQLRAFADWVGGGPAMVTDADDGIKNMAVIDAVYRAAGYAPRKPARA